MFRKVRQVSTIIDDGLFLALTTTGVGLEERDDRTTHGRLSFSKGLFGEVSVSEAPTLESMKALL